MARTAKDDGAPLALLVSAETDTSDYTSSMGPYLRITAHLVTFDGQHVCNIGASYKSEPRYGLDGLVVRAQNDASAARDGRDCYGWSTEYRNLYSIDLPLARAMTKVLERVERALAKVQAVAGRPESFGAYLVRVGAALGATTFLSKVGGSDRGWSYDQSDYRAMDAATVAYWVDDTEREFAKVARGENAQTA